MAFDRLWINFSFFFCCWNGWMSILGVLPTDHLTNWTLPKIIIKGHKTHINLVLFKMNSVKCLGLRNWIGVEVNELTVCWFDSICRNSFRISKCNGWRYWNQMNLSTVTISFVCNSKSIQIFDSRGGYFF